ncbi:hypothetical protein [Chromobacterium sphagni]|uniref:hypothetical protein n=1 Tax=Chromobacterium sphagni TaxID=1903179 RepID=UPI0011143706|nr:hypothetical protein [Chromobacterium sphagni]
MNSVVEQYFKLNPESQRNVQLFLCEVALEVWEKLIPENFIYRESVAGTSQIFDVTLPRKALDSVDSIELMHQVYGCYREPIVALQDGDVEFSEKAEYAYYAIYNFFLSSLHRTSSDPWLIPSHVLSAVGIEEAERTLELAINSLNLK